MVTYIRVTGRLESGIKYICVPEEKCKQLQALLDVEPLKLTRYAYNINHEMAESSVGLWCKYQEARDLFDQQQTCANEQCGGLQENIEKLQAEVKRLKALEGYYP